MQHGSLRRFLWTMKIFWEVPTKDDYITDWYLYAVLNNGIKCAEMGFLKIIITSKYGSTIKLLFNSNFHTIGKYLVFWIFRVWYGIRYEIYDVIVFIFFIYHSSQLAWSVEKRFQAIFMLWDQFFYHTQSVCLIDIFPS